MKVWTYYYARIKDLPSHILPISIAGWAPKGWTGLEYKKVAPKKDWFFEYKKTGDKEFYKRMYKATVLDNLNPEGVFKDLGYLLSMANYQKALTGEPQYTDVALCCYEKSGDFCHRNLLASFLSCRGFGVVEEWDPEKEKQYEVLRRIKSYEKTIFEFGREWRAFKGQGDCKPKEPGIYLTIRCGYSGIYTAINEWKDEHWMVMVADGSEVIAFKEEQIHGIFDET